MLRCQANFTLPGKPVSGARTAMNYNSVNISSPVFINKIIYGRMIPRYRPENPGRGESGLFGGIKNICHSLYRFGLKLFPGDINRGSAGDNIVDVQEQGKVVCFYPVFSDLRSDGGGGTLCDDNGFQGYSF